MAVQSPSARARDRLLDAVIAHFTDEGLADQSLRRIAEATGTSHRMLLYHFGSKEGLLLAVVQAVEARTQHVLAAAAAAVVTDPDVDVGQATDEVIRRMWAYGPIPRSRASNGCSSRSTPGRSRATTPARPLLEGDIEAWVEGNVALWPPPACRPRSRGRAPGVAVVRGLLLDLLATGDRAGVDAALEVFARGYAERLVGASAGVAGWQHDQ